MMRRSDAMRWAIGALMVCAGGSGCGAGGAPPVSTSMEKATVSGTVRFNGKPVSSGQISFDPSNVARKSVPVSVATIGKDGTYTVETLAGTNTVRLLNPKFRASRDDLTKRFEARGGANSYDLVLTNEGAAAMPGRRR